MHLGRELVVPVPRQHLQRVRHQQLLLPLTFLQLRVVVSDPLHPPPGRRRALRKAQTLTDRRRLVPLLAAAGTTAQLAVLEAHRGAEAARVLVRAD